MGQAWKQAMFFWFHLDYINSLYQSTVLINIVELKKLSESCSLHCAACKVCTLITAMEHEYARHVFTEIILQTEMCYCQNIIYPNNQIIILIKYR